MTFAPSRDLCPLPWPLPPLPSSASLSSAHLNVRSPGVFPSLLAKLDRKLKSSYDLNLSASGWLEPTRRLRYHSCNSSHVGCHVSFLWPGGCVWQLLLLAVYLNCAVFWLFCSPLCFCCCFPLSFLAQRLRANVINPSHVLKWWQMTDDVWLATSQMPRPLRQS